MLYVYRYSKKIKELLDFLVTIVMDRSFIIAFFNIPKLALF